MICNKACVANAVQKLKLTFPAIKQQSVYDVKHKYLELKSSDPSESVSKI